jgi:hypothetical protein
MTDGSTIHCFDALKALLIRRYDRVVPRLDGRPCSRQANSRHGAIGAAHDVSIEAKELG